MALIVTKVSNTSGISQPLEIMKAKFETHPTTQCIIGFTFADTSKVSALYNI